MDKIRRGKPGARSRFEPAVKRKAVLDYHHSNASLAAVAGKYGICRRTLVDWIKWYEREGAELVTLEAMEPNKVDDASDGHPLPQDVKALQEELRLARVKLACLESLIDITERDLGIDIRKKAGTRSSEE